MLPCITPECLNRNFCRESRCTNNRRDLGTFFVRLGMVRFSIPGEDGPQSLTPTSQTRDTTTLQETLCEAGMTVEELVGREAELRPNDEPKVNVNGIEEAAR